jgi:hypothetical protein
MHQLDSQSPLLPVTAVDILPHKVLGQALKDLQTPGQEVTAVVFSCVTIMILDQPKT